MSVLDDEISFVHSLRADVELVREEVYRRLANDILEFLDEVWLIGQTTGVSDFRPRSAFPAFREDFLKAREPRKSLRTDFESGIEGA